MTAPSHELVGLAMARLRGHSGVKSLVGSRIWHRAPEGSDFPRIARFDTSGIRADAACIESARITLDVHLWTRDAVDPLQDARALAFEVARALHGYPLSMPTNRLVTLDHRGERIFYEPDGLTGHGVVEFLAVTQSI